MAFQQDTGISSIQGAQQGHGQIHVTKVCDTFGEQVLLEDIDPAGHNLETLEPK